MRLVPRQRLRAPFRCGEEMKTPEGYEKDDIRAFLNQSGAWHLVTQNLGYGKSGVPDIVACIPRLITADMVGSRLGLFAGVEVKREGKGPTVIQDKRMNEIWGASGLACWGTAARVIPILKSWL